MKRLRVLILLQVGVLVHSRLSPGFFVASRLPINLQSEEGHWEYIESCQRANRTKQAGLELRTLDPQFSLLIPRPSVITKRLWLLHIYCMECKLITGSLQGFYIKPFANSTTDSQQLVTPERTFRSPPLKLLNPPPNPVVHSVQLESPQ